VWCGGNVRSTVCGGEEGSVAGAVGAAPGDGGESKSAVVTEQGGAGSSPGGWAKIGHMGGGGGRGDLNGGVRATRRRFVQLQVRGGGGRALGFAWRGVLNNGRREGTGALSLQRGGHCGACDRGGRVKKFVVGGKIKIHGGG